MDCAFTAHYANNSTTHRVLPFNFNKILYMALWYIIIPACCCRRRVHYISICINQWVSRARSVKLYIKLQNSITKWVWCTIYASRTTYMFVCQIYTVFLYMNCVLNMFFCLVVVSSRDLLAVDVRHPVCLTIYDQARGIWRTLTTSLSIVLNKI